MMRPLNVLVCSGNKLTEQQMAKTLAGQGMQAQTSHQILDGLDTCRADWDLVIVDLNGINGFLCGILPLVRHKLPHMPAIGIRTQSAMDNETGLACGIELDAYLSEIPQPDELFIHFPQVISNRQAQLAI